MFGRYDVVHKRDVLLATLFLAGLVHARSCPESWHHRGGFCYNMTSAAVSFTDATDVCRRLNSTVASVLSQEENDFIGEIIKPNSYWIGLRTVPNYFYNQQNLTRRRQGWRWLDGSNYDLASWTNWYEGNEENKKKPEPKEEKNFTFMFFENNAWKWRGGDQYLKWPVVCKFQLRVGPSQTANTKSLSTITLSTSTSSSRPSQETSMESSDSEPIAAIVGGVCASLVLILLFIAAFIYIRRRRAQLKDLLEEPPECPYYNFSRASPGDVSRKVVVKTNSFMDRIVRLGMKRKPSQKVPTYYNVAQIGKDYQTSTSGSYKTTKPASSVTTFNPVAAAAATGASSGGTMVTPYAVTGLMIGAQPEPIPEGRASGPYDNAGFVNGQPPVPEHNVGGGT